MLHDFIADLAAARAGQGGDVDNNRSYLRGRIAAVLWIPGMAIALFAGGLTGSWEVGVAIVVLTVATMSLVAYGPRRIAARFRRRSAKPS